MFSWRKIDIFKVSVQIVAKFFLAKIVEKSTQNQTKSRKNAKKCPRAPKSVTKRSGTNVPQLLGPSWAALGTLPGHPGGAPGRPKRSQEHQNSSPKPFFAHFFASFFHVAFCIHFWSSKLCNHFYRNVENINFSSGKHTFSQNRFFRLATKMYRKITSKTLRFESQNRKK